MIISEPGKTFMAIFGTGDILLKGLNITHKDTKVNYLGIGFSQIEEGEVGRIPEKYKGVELHHPIQMVFSNSKSVEIVIEGLEKVKEMLIKKESE